jgi:hypothetical protein
MPVARAGGLLLAIAAICLTSGYSLNDLRAVAMQAPFPATTDAAIAKLHDPEALRADLDFFMPDLSLDIRFY